MLPLLADLAQLVPKGGPWWLLLGGVVFVVLMVLSGFFSSSELAMFSLARHRIDTLVGEGVPGAALVQELREEPHRMLVTILVGNNLANIAMSAIATALLGLYLSPGQAVLATTLGVTSLVLVFSESAPKSYAVAHAESWALRVARPLQICQTVLGPIVAVFDRLTRAVNRVTGGQPNIETAYVTRSEIQELIQAGEQQGVLEASEGKILKRTLRFTRTIAREVMVPRASVEAVPVTASPAEALERALAAGHDHLPVHDGDLDTVLGTVQVRDLVRATDRADPPADLRDLVSPTIVVPETKPVDDLLALMRRDRVPMAIVMDEFGAVTGLVTIEDIVESLVGSILQPEEEPPVERLDPRTAIVRGDVTVEVFNEALGTELPDHASYETIAGLLLEQAGRMLEEGERVEAFGLTFSPVRVEGRRILKVRVELPADDAA